MGLFDWLNPTQEKNRLLIEVSDDNNDAYLIDVPYSRKTVDQLIHSLNTAGIKRDQLPESRVRIEIKDKEFQGRDHDQYRWQADESVDKEENLEDNGDFEPDDFREHDYCDDEASHQPAVRFWPNW